MKINSINELTKTKILSFIKPVEDWKANGPFCVDGRDGAVDFSGQKSKQHLFVQALGGSLLIAVVAFLDSKEISFDKVLTTTLNNLKSKGFGIGVHYGGHRHGDTSDCGFADNLQKIIRRLYDKQDEIKGIIDNVAPGVLEEATWNELTAKALEKSEDELPGGADMVGLCKSKGANIQTVEGNHAELTAIVNLKPNTTLDTRGLVNAGIQSFNLDLWYVLEQAKVLGINEGFAKHASLGLYVATEMVLVEDKNNYRLPIIINS